MGADGFVLVPYGEYGGSAAYFPLLQGGADVGTVSAANAAVGDLGVEKALLVAHHMDGALGTPAGTRAASGAMVMGRQLRFYGFCHGTASLPIIMGCIVTQWRKIGK